MTKVFDKAIKKKGITVYTFTVMFILGLYKLFILLSWSFVAFWKSALF